ncbi:hypothetical protein, partial [Helicobacter turcicus]
MNLQIQVTSGCNYTCGMCHFHGEKHKEEYFKKRPELRKDMSLKEIETILQKAKDYGVKTIDFTPNGEFFTYKNW